MHIIHWETKGAGTSCSSSNSGRGYQNGKQANIVRRTYDNSLNQPARSSGSSGFPYSPHSPGARPSSQGPHRAWGRRPPPSGRSPNEPFNPFSRQHAYPRSEPFGQAGPGPFGRTSTGRKPPPSTEYEGLKAEGGLWRFSVVVGLLVAVVSFGGGLSVSAEELVPTEVDERRASRPAQPTIRSDKSPDDGA